MARRPPRAWRRASPPATARGSSCRARRRRRRRGGRATLSKASSREQERLEAHVGLVAHEGQRVRQREDDQVVLACRCWRRKARPSLMYGSTRGRCRRAGRGAARRRSAGCPGRSRPRRRARRPRSRASATSEPLPAPTTSTSPIGPIGEPLVDLVVEGLLAGRATGWRAWCGMPLTLMVLLAVRVARQADAVVGGVRSNRASMGPGCVDEEEDGRRGRRC